MMDMDPVSDFTTKFNNLEGDTYDERLRNLFMLLQSFKSVEESIQLDIATSLSPRNYTEILFKIETSIFFKCYDVLLEILTTEVDGKTRKILKQRWFIQRLFESDSVEVFVEETLPKFSIVHRKRLLNYLIKYYKGNDKMNQLLDILLSTYGLDLAKVILPACNIDKIKSTLDNYQINLTQRQLIYIYNKDRDLFQSLLEKSRSQITESQLLKLHKYISSLDVKYCFDFEKEIRHSYNRFGKQYTKNLLVKYKSEFLENPTYYMSLLKRKTARNTLTIDEKLLALVNAYPEKLSDYQFKPINLILQLFPSNDIYEVYSKTFYQKYNQTLFNNPIQMPESLVEDIQNVDEREKWIPLKITDTFDTHYIIYYERYKAFDLIKSKINFTSTYRTREILMEKLADLYKYYKDKELLLEILKYVCKRHRNDDTLSSFYNQLYHHCDLTALNEEHWKYIFELRDIAKLKRYNFSGESLILLKHIEYLWRKKLPIKENVIEYTEKEGLDNCVYSMKDLKDMTLQKTLLEIFLEIIPQKEYKDNNRTHINFLYWIFDWNKKNPGNQFHIHNYPHLVNSFKSYLESTTRNFHLDDIFLSNLYTKKLDAFGEFLLPIFFNEFLENNHKITVKIISWYLKINPNILLPYADNTVIAYLYSNIKCTHQIWSYIKKQINYPFYQKSIEYGLENYNKNFEQAGKIMQILAFLMSTEEYIDLISKHIPADRMETDDDTKDKYFILYIEKGIARSFVYCRSIKVVPALFPFCVGESLRDSLNSLWYYFLHSPVTVLKQKIKSFPFQHNLSVIQTFTFTCLVDTLKDAIHYMNFTFQNGNVKVRSTILKKALKYAKKNPSTELYEEILQVGNFELINEGLLKQFEKFVDIPSQYKLQIIDVVFNYTATHGEENLLPKLGEIALKHLGTDLSKIPIEYKSKFLKYSIEHCKIHSDSCALKVMITNFIHNINDTFLNDVPIKVCNSFIDFYFLNNNEFVKEDILYSFTAHYLCNYPERIGDKWNFIFEKIKKYQTQNSGSFLDKLRSKNKIHKFHNALIKHVKSKDVNFIKEFYNIWCKTFQIFECFEVFCFLRILIIFKESKDDKIICERIFSLVEEIYSISSSTYLFDQLAGKFKQIYESRLVNLNQNLYSFCATLYELSKDVPNCIFILLLLPKDVTNYPDDHKKYTELLHLISCHEDSLVRIQYNLFLT